MYSRNRETSVQAERTNDRDDDDKDGGSADHGCGCWEGARGVFACCSDVCFVLLSKHESVEDEKNRRDA